MKITKTELKTLIEKNVKNILSKQIFEGRVRLHPDDFAKKVQDSTYTHNWKWVDKYGIKNVVGYINDITRDRKIKALGKRLNYGEMFAYAIQIMKKLDKLERDEDTDELIDKEAQEQFEQAEMVLIYIGRKVPPLSWL